jgi:hypothetical protein
MDQFQLLVDSVPVNTNPVGRQSFCLPLKLQEIDGYDSLMTRLRAKVPNIVVDFF